MLRDVFHKFYLRFQGVVLGENVKIGKIRFKNGLRKTKIGNRVVIGNNVFIRDLGGVVIGDDCYIDDNVMFLSASHDPSDEAWRIFGKEIVVEDGVYIGWGAIILPGVTISKGARIEPKSIVRKSVLSESVIVGEH